LLSLAAIGWKRTGEGWDIQTMAISDEDKGKKAKGRQKLQEPSRTPQDPQIFDMIGRRLKDYYEDVAKQPVPDRFLELLRKLDKKSEE